jgi:O-antigen/teichoic acid export membrane protein
MLSYFKNFARHSFIYSIGSGLSRAASFLLVPLYTRVLTTSDSGLLEMFYVVAGVLGTLLGMNIAHGTLRFFFEFDDEIERKRVVSTSLITTFIFSSAIVLLLGNYTGELSRLLFKSDELQGLFWIIFSIVFMQLSNEIGFAYLRVKEKSLLYVGISVLQLCVQISLNLYTVLVLKLGVKGILIGNMISVFAVWVALMGITFSYCGLRFHLPKLKLLLHYCMPFILSAGAGVVIYNADRIMLNSYANLAVVGIYALGTKFGIALRDLVIGPFTINFGQSRFAIMKQQNAKDIYARIVTYFSFVMVFLSLGVILFIRELLMVLSGHEFWDAYKIVPLIFLPVILNGIGYIFQTGMLLQKKTKAVFYINVIAAILIVAMNRLLIPAFGMYGAALSTLGAMLFSCLATYIISQRLYPIKYEFARTGKLFIVGILLSFVPAVFPGVSLVSVAMKILLFLSFPVILTFVSFYTQEEKQMIQKGVRALYKVIRKATGLTIQSLEQGS